MNLSFPVLKNPKNTQGPGPNSFSENSIFLRGSGFLGHMSFQLKDLLKASFCFRIFEGTGDSFKQGSTFPRK